ncbi:OmpA family protein [Aureibacter tunicatorum]|uniref:Outer membrane protein OmpA-like peptidoglycan-associated protein n=1 Tax=Aureibacter tunicatorum TaxID=866807 RepID=A0AAE4BSY0_9BACT|nr:OmpA family protein [Aureibacter tunicatorum]MDR6239380.1 outer membrane protein OmpA-like peptidoglycan-associated protein [Aureibacter tunicatorum]BDD04697.1 cell envelope biogenesis protein OmpA [Aureibacter tunicatorum]
MFKKLLFLFYFVFFLIFGSFETIAQQTPVNKKAQKLYDQAIDQLRKRDFPKAIESLNKAIEKDPHFVRAYMELATCYEIKRDQKSYYEVFNRLMNAGVTGLNHPSLFPVLAEVCMQKGDYENAEKMARKHLAANPRDPRKKAKSEKILRNVEFAKKAMQEELPYSPERLPEPLNKFALQYFPTFTVDGKTIYFTRREQFAQIADEDIFVSHLDNGSWSEPVSISENINTPANEGTCSISADGKTMIFTSCQEGRNNVGSCDLFISYKVGDSWTKPMNMGLNINSAAWESQPSLSADGRTLYFVSARSGGFGGRDIYVSYLDENNEWGKAINLGSIINTEGEDIGPFIHSSGDRLYFASNGHAGMGGYDLFYSDKNELGGWEKPVNLGYPINNHLDQISLVVSTDGRKAYYSEDETIDAKVYSHIYSFDMPEKLRIKKKTNYIAGVVRDSKTKKALRADLELYDLRKDSLMSKVYSDKLNGQYAIVLTEGKEYGIFATSKGYLFKSLSFNYSQKQFDEAEAIFLDIEMDPIEELVNAELKNVFFASNSYELKEKSKVELDKLTDFLHSNPSLIIEIGGHTDDIGAESFNDKLSLNRAKAVYDYLVDSGIPSEKVTYKGYGESQPKVSNNTEEGRAQNRRIEFKIIEMEL